MAGDCPFFESEMRYLPSREIRADRNSPQRVQVVTAWCTHPHSPCKE